MSGTGSGRDALLHLSRPTVYLDQWVWFMLASAAKGKPRSVDDLRVLEAVRAAADAGVAFPLSSTRYLETARISNHNQRRDLAEVMAPISRMLNLAPSSYLVSHQMRTALHEQFGIPGFRPPPVDALNLGAKWAMLAEPAHITVRVGDRLATPNDVSNLPAITRAVGQLTEFKLLAGPEDEDIAALRANGYKPETLAASTASRVDWEKEYTSILAGDPINRDELRVRLCAREFVHEYLDTFNKIAAEYRLDLFRLMREDANVPGSMRADMMRFTDALPTLRIAAEMKIEMFRNPSRPWTHNMLFDIDAISAAVPYCHVVLADGDARDMLRRSKAHERYGTLLPSLPELPDILTDLRRNAEPIDNPSAWDHIGPSAPYCTRMEDLPKMSYSTN